MKLFDFLFKNKKHEEHIRKQKALKIHEEVEDLIQVYIEELIKRRVFTQDICNGLRDLYISQLNREFELYLEFPKHSIQFENENDVFNFIVSKISNQFNKLINVL